MQAMATIADPSKQQPDAVAPVYASFFKKHNEMIETHLKSLEGTELTPEMLEAANAETSVRPLAHVSFLSLLKSKDIKDQ